MLARYFDLPSEKMYCAESEEQMRRNEESEGID